MEKQTLISLLLLITLILGLAFIVWAIASGSAECKASPMNYAEKELTKHNGVPFYCSCSTQPPMRLNKGPGLELPENFSIIG